MDTQILTSKINQMKYRQNSIEEKVIGKLRKINELLSKKNISSDDIIKSHSIAREVVYLYYVCRLKHKKRVMGMDISKNGIVITKIGAIDCNIDLNQIQNNLDMTQPNEENEQLNGINIDVARQELSNFLFNVQHFDSIYASGQEYFNLTTMFNIKYKGILFSEVVAMSDGSKKIVWNITRQVGLQHLRNTCYINAALQTFLNSPGIRNYFRFGTHPQLSKKNFSFENASQISLSYIFKKSLEEICKLSEQINLEAKHIFYTPVDFVNALYRLDPQSFPNGRSGCSEAVVDFALCEFNKELRVGASKKISEKQTSKINNINIRNINCSKIKKEISEDITKFQSYIFDNNYGFSVFTKTCQNINDLALMMYCQYKDIFIIIDETKKTQPSVATLVKQTYKLRTGLIENQQCLKCGKTHNFRFNEYLVTVPKNFILQMGQLQNQRIDFTEYLDQYAMSDELLPEMKWIYKRLYSVIVYLNNRHHYISYTISQQDGVWYKFDDSSVNREIDFNKIKKCGLPTMCFYSNMEPESMLIFVSNKVIDNIYRENIACRFADLDVNQRQRFAYLLMCVAEKSEIHKLGQKNSSNLICAIFELIKNEKNFDDDYMEKNRIVICEIVNSIGKETKQQNQNEQKKQNVKNDMVMGINDIINKINSHVFTMKDNNSFNVNIEFDQDIYVNENEINTNQINNNIIANNDARINKLIGENTVLNKNNHKENKFVLHFESVLGNTFSIEFSNENTTLGDVFYSLKKKHPDIFMYCKNPNIIFDGKKLSLTSNISILKIPCEARLTIINQNKISVSGTIFALIFFIGAIVSAITEFFILATVLISLAAFSAFGKLIASSCFGYFDLPPIYENNNPKNFRDNFKYHSQTTFEIIPQTTDNRIKS